MFCRDAQSLHFKRTGYSIDISPSVELVSNCSELYALPQYQEASTIRLST